MDMTDKNAQDLTELIKDPASNREAIIRSFEEILTQAIASVNSQFAYRRLAKLSRQKEPLPTALRQLSSYRTRLGTMLEYSISSQIDAVLKRWYGERVSLTFVVSHKYPNFYLRDSVLEKCLRIEMKCVDCESDEQAARFDAPTADIDPNRDFVLFVGWEWKKEKLDNGEEWEHPSIFAHVFVPAIELTRERDIRLYSIGGKIEDGKVLVPSTKRPGTFVPDPGNYGKFWRIVLPRRRTAPDLSEQIKRFIEFQKEVDKRAPRRRIKKGRGRQTHLSALTKI